ncbi:DNA cytosine methyltransferase [Billgrantia sp. Q4P2]|uniref:DNA cytosine methyltransferase n=1 Tax=Billgrantia sp. Q4P2 TaxID=3463857 RepID=UPI0040571824
MRYFLLEVWSFFTGAMGLDIGLERAGLETTLAVENDRACRKVIAQNRPQITQPENGDVSHISVKELRGLRGCETSDVFLMVGGPPCQSFSSGGKRAALGDPRGNLIYEYLSLIKEVRPEYFVLENVANLVTAALRHRKIEDRPGKHWSLKKYQEGKVITDCGTKQLEWDEMPGSAVTAILEDVEKLGYSVSFGVLDAADHGAPQHRLRFIMIGARNGGAPEMPLPSHGDAESGLLPFRTVREAIQDIKDNPGDHSRYTPEVARFFELVPAGGNWRNLPIELQKEALGGSYAAGGGKTGFFRRLPWDSPSPTVTGRPNRKGSAMCHPEQVRPLSVKECSRLQGFPDNWKFSGSMSSQYLQVGNAVPTALGKAVGDAILAHFNGRHSEQRDYKEMLQDAQYALRSRARNKKTKANIKAKAAQTDLFAS